MYGKLLLSAMLIMPLAALSQKKADKKILGDLNYHLTHLLRDTGSAGTLHDYEYIENQFRSAGIRPAGDHGSYRETVVTDKGMYYLPGTTLKVNDKTLIPGRDFIPLSYSAQGAVSGEPLIAVQEQNLPWIMNITNYIDSQIRMTDTGIAATLYRVVLQAEKDKASAVLFYHNTEHINDIPFDPEESFKPVNIPVVYMNSMAAKQYFRDSTASVNVKLQVEFHEKKDTAYPVIGEINNHAPATIIISANQPADKAVLIELAKLLKNNRQYEKQNYLFIAFSGEEPGYPLSKYFIKHGAIDLNQVNCMINLDGTGRLALQNPVLSVDGINTSSLWKAVLDKVKSKQIAYKAETPTPADTSLMEMHIPTLSFSAPGTGHANAACELKVVEYMAALVRELNRTERLVFAR
jgi:hypothetical protein